MCVLNKKTELDSPSAPADAFDVITILEDENRELPTAEFYDYLLGASGLLVSYNPKSNPSSALVESIARRKHIRTIRIDDLPL